MKVVCLGCGFKWWKPPHTSEQYVPEVKPLEVLCLPCQEKGTVSLKKYDEEEPQQPEPKVINDG